MSNHIAEAFGQMAEPLDGCERLFWPLLILGIIGLITVLGLAGFGLYWIISSLL